MDRPETRPQTRPQTRLFGLDLLRGLAAIVVLVMHIAGFKGGHLAVDFFFMLSGYVMARTYEERLRSGEVSSPQFMWMRVKRLWPVMAIGAVLGLNVALIAAGPSADLGIAFVFAMLLLPASAVTPYLLNLPAWSIFYELVANAFHAAWFAHLSDRVLILALGVCSALFIASFAVTGFPRILHETTITMQVAVIFRALVSYIIGVLAYRLLKDRAPFHVPVLAGCALMVGYIVLVSAVQFPLWPVPFIFVIAPIAMISGLDPSAPKQISHILGQMSFPLYAIHFPVIALCALAGFGPGTAFIASLAVAALWLIPARPVRWKRVASAA